MIFIVGRKTAALGRFLDKDQICYPCKSSERDVWMQQDYAHFCLIPCLPHSKKQVNMRCRNCGNETKMDNVVKRYQDQSKTPIYFFSGPILAVLLAAGWFYWNHLQTKNNITYSETPVVADVYTLVKEEDGIDRYSFLRVAGISPDTVYFLHNTLDYGGFVSNLADDDYFQKDDTVALRKRRITEMLTSKEIHSIERGSAHNKSYNRIK